MDIRLIILNGKLLVHSPIKPEEELLRSLAAIGEVEYLVAPNAFHHLFLEKWLQRFPQAKTFGPRILSKKRPNLQIDQYFDSLPAEPWGPDIQVELIKGMPKVEELAIYHRPSKTLIVTDLIFNLREANGAMKWILRLMGTYNRPALSRLMRFMIKDKAAYSQSIAKLLNLQIERLIMAHGRIIEGQECQSLQLASIMR